MCEVVLAVASPLGKWSRCSVPAPLTVVPSLMGHFLWSAPEEGKSQRTSWVVATTKQYCWKQYTEYLNRCSATVSSLLLPLVCQKSGPAPWCFILLTQNRRACLLSLTSARKMSSEISGVYYNNSSFCSKTALGEMVVQADDLLNKTSNSNSAI